MSTIACPFEEFNKKVKIEHHIIFKEKNEGKFIIAIQCLEEKMNTNLEKEKLLRICKKHDVHYKSSG